MNAIKKIDILKQQYLLFVDTETIGTLEVQQGILPFEIGIKILDIKTMQIVKEKSYIIQKFFNNKYIMLGTFSASKYPSYFEKINNDNRYKLVSTKQFTEDLNKLIKRYNITIMVAHNSKFDYDAITRLANEFGLDSPVEKLDLLDTMEISKIITFSKDYATFCLDNKDILNSKKERKFITNSGRVRITAEAINCYLSNNVDFKEAHTGLEDLEIEIEIFKKSLDMLGNTMVNLNTTPRYSDYSVILEEEEI